MADLENNQLPVSDGSNEPAKPALDIKAMAEMKPLTPEILPRNAGEEGTSVAAMSGTTGDKVAVKHPGRPKGKLGKRSLVFIELILAGKSTLEAYRLCGFKGQNNAAYVLRCQLRDRIEEKLMSDGISREGAMIELKKLLALPLNQSTVSVKEKIQILKYLQKITEVKDAEAKPQITPFLVNIQDPKQVTVNPQL